MKSASINVTCFKNHLRQSLVWRHLCIHSGERRYTCDVYNMSFSQKYNLKKHQHIHSWQRPYSWYVCKNAFSNV